MVVLLWLVQVGLVGFVLVDRLVYSKGVWVALT